MWDKLDLFFRADTVAAEKQKERRAGRHAIKPELALIFHCVPTADEKQELLFGAYICAQLIDGKYIAKEIGLFSRDGHPEELRVLIAL